MGEAENLGIYNVFECKKNLHEATSLGQFAHKIMFLKNMCAFLVSQEVVCSLLNAEIGAVNNHPKGSRAGDILP